MSIKRIIDSIRHNNHRNKITGRTMEPERLGWDRENNNRPIEIVNDNPGEIRIFENPPFNCPTHGNISNVVTFHINGTDYPYCTECLHEVLRRHFAPLERANSDRRT